MAQKQIVLTETEDVEYLTSALSVYIEYLTEKYSSKSDDDNWMAGPWLESNDPSCTHEQTVEAPPASLDLLFENHPDDRPTKALLCTNEKCLARQHIVSGLDAVRETIRGAIELRQRIVKEWGYDPTNES